ncbi:hypothetical protein [Roseospira navarrensis]|uniref:Uncharacterized protein n=1 Tax=Roseospira navarrensis TaxID=140058 RepID=A0A7X2D1X8_9PROT|nr:hypothetical protein [Roseospira navarrensis]MQX35679.1 hypothetical protein [Roseospira navarrensis]
MTVTRLDQADHEANTWLNRLTETPAVETRNQAYGALRAVLEHSALEDIANGDAARFVVAGAEGAYGPQARKARPHTAGH